MYCYKHPEIMAHQLCGTCFKSLCKECSIKIEGRPEVVVCCESCYRDYDENLQMHKRAQKMYGIGPNSHISSFSLTRLSLLFLGIALTSWSAILFWQQSEDRDLVILTFILGAFFCMFLLGDYLRQKKFGIKY